MKKLFKLKNFLSIKETARRLRASLEEDVSVSDVVQLILQKDLPLWIHLNGQFAIDVTSPALDDLSMLDPKDYTGDSSVELVEGNFEICLDRGCLNFFAEWLEQFVENIETTIIHQYPCSPIRILVEQGGVKRKFYLLNVRRRRDAESKWSERESFFTTENVLNGLLNLFIKRQDIELLEKRIAVDHQPASKNQDSLGTKERCTYQKMILGMAKTKYDYNPGVSKNKATGKNNGSICADLQTHGLDLDADTIRKYLADASEQFAN